MDFYSLCKDIFFYGIPLLCLLMFIRELIVSYFIRAKFESSVSVVLSAIASKINKIENIIDHNPNRISSDIQAFSDIYRLVSSKRATLTASRSYILRFHDGASFSTNAPVWKVSLQNESTDSAIKPIAEYTKDMLIANVIQIVAPVFNSEEDEEAKENGIIYLNSDTFLTRRVIKIDTDNVINNQIKRFLLRRSIKHFYYTPIVDSNDKPIALFCVDYIADVPKTITDEFIATELDNGASVLSTMMT